MAIGDRPAIVHANDWNTMWAGLIVKLMTGCALIYDSHELWADRNGRWEWRPWLIGCEWLFVHFADAVVTTSPGHAAVLARRYRIGMPEVVRNVPEQLAPPGDRQAGLLAYVGGMMPGRGLEQAIDALALMPEARLRAIGPGSAAYRESLRHRAQSRGVSARVTLADPVPANRVVDELSVAAAGLCLIQPICLSYELCLPNKLFEYVAAGLPVLCSDLPVMAQVVRENGLGALTPPDDVAAIAQRTRELLAPDPDQARRTATFARANQWSLEAPRLARIYAEWGAGQSAARA
jgi:glycosyltransferase involved in cell wall biosynthesis